jgi:hypothetical protein
MPLLVYNDGNFTIATAVDQTDTYVGDGITSTFPVVNKNISRLGATITFDGTQYYYFTGGFTRSGSSFTLASIPLAGTQGVAPGLNNILFDNVYDQDTVDGLIAPRVQEVPFYIADITTIHLYSYEAFPTFPGMAFSVVDNVTSYGAQTSWIQLACATQDSAGTAMTYQATGTTLFTDALDAFGSVMASASAGASSITVSNASSFILGDYIMMNIGYSTQEIQHLVGFTPPNTLIFDTKLQYNHQVNEGMWACARKFWARCSIPEGATGGQAASLSDLSLRTQYSRQSNL